ncbi:unnamed protein product [Prorocentrum cordatum]|uniref:Fe2OG dioxygenase domain-containing protein n=1 Tax=Prorocentrum cordatum TaxID=2364126 RepID=A0ABN9UYP2_9DINO|nr:unnamed protein product [Polarella glacialis]
MREWYRAREGRGRRGEGGPARHQPFRPRASFFIFPALDVWTFCPLRPAAAPAPMRCLAAVAAAAAALLPAGCQARGQQGSQTASGCDPNMPRDDGVRVKEFNRIYGKWPPKISLPGKEPQRETKEWLNYHRKKEAGLMELTDHTQRWEFWLEQAQIRLLKNFTETGWGQGHMAKKTHKKVLDHFRKSLPELAKKSNHSIPLYTTGEQVLVNLPNDLSQEVTEVARLKIAEWAKVDASTLEPTSTYGIQNYWKGSTLKTHVDRVETHILSAVYCVDSSYPEGAEPWLMETDPDVTGVHAAPRARNVTYPDPCLRGHASEAVDVKPGELFFYESAKLVHGRPTTLQGDYSAHIFIHFRPYGWSFQNVDRVYGVPPGFNGAALRDKQEAVEL